MSYKDVPNTRWTLRVNIFLQYAWVKGSVCFILKFALPPYSLSFSPLECKYQTVSNQNMH